MKTIEVDFDVWQLLTNKLSSESDTYNNTIRRLLGLKPLAYASTILSPIESNASDWISIGVRFPAGTEFRANHKGRDYFGKVEKGALVVQGHNFQSPSKAAVFITNNSVNGWMFWEARRPGEENWRMIKSLRSDK